MEDLPLGRIAALVPEFSVKDLPLGRTLMMTVREGAMPQTIKVELLPFCVNNVD